jgi:hypothetical protein
MTVFIVIYSNIVMNEIDLAAAEMVKMTESMCGEV